MQIVTTALALNFHVDPSRVDDLYENVGREYKDRIIDPAVQESLKVVTSRYTAEELIKYRARSKLLRRRAARAARPTPRATNVVGPGTVSTSTSQTSHGSTPRMFSQLVKDDRTKRSRPGGRLQFS
ncbi:MAG: SPFH domain-containing protein [Fimbriimonadales bacterium]